ncbi:hypothetical protein PG987_001778 [Apiospora arundinis]
MPSLPAGVSSAMARFEIRAFSGRRNIRPESSDLEVVQDTLYLHEAHGQQVVNKYRKELHPELFGRLSQVRIRNDLTRRRSSRGSIRKSSITLASGVVGNRIFSGRQVPQAADEPSPQVAGALRRGPRRIAGRAFTCEIQGYVALARRLALEVRVVAEHDLLARRDVPRRADGRRISGRALDEITVPFAMRREAKAPQPLPLPLLPPLRWAGEGMRTNGASLGTGRVW